MGRWLPLWSSWRCETFNEARRTRSHHGRGYKGTPLEAEAGRLCNAGRYKRTEARRDQRSGDLANAEAQLDSLRQICLIGCDEYIDLERAIATYQVRAGSECRAPGIAPRKQSMVP
jgi:hypothetical protein